MKNMKALLVALSLIIFTSVSYAGGIGYIDYVKVIDNYDCSAYYEPSYVIARAYQNGGF